jgi:anti-sigma factor RsiW
MNDDELSALIRNNASRHKASEQLRASVRTQIALQSAARDDETKDATELPRLGAKWRGINWSRFGWGSAVAGFTGGVAVTLLVALILPRMMTQNSLPAALVADHVRALKVGPLIEVASNDKHTVKPWFQGKLDYAPPVPDLEADGFPLLGGRIERVASAPVAAIAALAYASNKHIVNVFVWPSDREQAAQRLQRSGFNVMHWSDGAMAVWVVSDMDSSEVDRFAQTWRARAAIR